MDEGVRYILSGAPEEKLSYQAINHTNKSKLGEAYIIAPHFLGMILGFWHLKHLSLDKLKWLAYAFTCMICGYKFQ